MEQILIQVKDRRKAKMLVQFLKALDFVENVSSTDLPQDETVSDEAIAVSQFFDLAGLWAGRQITSEMLRQKTI